MAKHEAISRELRTEIETGKYGTNGQLPSETQLVKRFQVSRPTAARALRDLQNEGLVERRMGSGTFVTPPSERNSGQRQTTVIGLLVPERGMTEIFDAICGELGALAKMQGFGILWGSSSNPLVDRDPSPDHALALCRQFVDKRVDVVLFAPLETRKGHEAANREILEIFQQAGIPVVLLDRDITPFPRRSRWDLVCMDNFCAGFLLGEHLIRLGSKNLRFVARPDSPPTIDARVSGVREAIRSNRLNLDSELVAIGDPSDIEFIRKLRAGRDFDCLVCANDITAGQVIKSLNSLSIRVPTDVRVAGFDDLRHATLLPVALTTIHQPCREIAEMAFRVLLERLTTPRIPPRTITAAPRLVVRESCGAYERKG